MRQIRQRYRERVAALLDLGELGLELLDLGRDRLHPLDHVGGVLARALARRDLLGSLVLRGSAALGLRQQLPATRVELEQLVESVSRAAARERLPGRARVVADSPQVEHGGAL